MATVLLALAKFGGPLGIVLTFSYLVVYRRRERKGEPRLSMAKKVLLTLAFFGLTVVTVLGWRHEEFREPNITIQSTSGPNSPAISNVQGNVTISSENQQKR